MKSSLHNTGIEMYSALNEVKSVVAEKFSKALKNKIYKYMTAVSKNVHIDVTAGMYFKYDVDHNDKDPKFKVGDHVRISKYKNAFGNGYTLNQSEEVFLIRKVKNTVPWTYIIRDLNNEQVVGTFYEKEMQKTS